jgi:hypothetical protein
VNNAEELRSYLNAYERRVPRFDEQHEVCAESDRGTGEVGQAPRGLWTSCRP